MASYTIFSMLSMEHLFTEAIRHANASLNASVASEAKSPFLKRFPPKKGVGLMGCRVDIYKRQNDKYIKNKVYIYISI